MDYERIRRCIHLHPAMFGEMGDAKERQAERILVKAKARLAPKWAAERRLVQHAAGHQHREEPAMNEKWTWHTEGRRAFVLDVDGYVVCEIIAPTINNDGTRAAEIAQRIVSDHNRVLDDLPIALWDCPVCHENTKERADTAEARLNKALERFFASGCNAAEVAEFLHVSEEDARLMLQGAEARLVMRE